MSRAEKRRLLIVDDDPVLQAALLEALERAGYEGCAVETLDSARDSIDEGEFDAVLLHVPLSEESRATSFDGARKLSSQEMASLARWSAAPRNGDSPLSNELELRRNVERLERRLILRALVIARGNRAQAARLLGIRRALLYARLKSLPISDESR
jgi:DNA-binding NtrC family response regulator